MTHGRGRKSDKPTWWSPPGHGMVSTIRILPDKHGGEDFYREYKYHAGVFPVMDRTVCKGKECPLCAKHDELLSFHRIADARQFKASLRVLFNIFDLEAEEVLIWSAPIYVLEQLLQFCVQPRIGDVSDLKTGRYIEIHGARRNPPYFEHIAISMAPHRSKFTIDLSDLPDLDEVIKKMHGEILQEEKPRVRRVIRCT